MGDIGEQTAVEAWFTAARRAWTEADDERADDDPADDAGDERADGERADDDPADDAADERADDERADHEPADDAGDEPGFVGSSMSAGASWVAEPADAAAGEEHVAGLGDEAAPTGTSVFDIQAGVGRGGEATAVDSPLGEVDAPATEGTPSDGDDETSWQRADSTWARAGGSRTADGPAAASAPALAGPVAPEGDAGGGDGDPYAYDDDPGDPDAPADGEPAATEVDPMMVGGALLALAVVLAIVAALALPVFGNDDDLASGGPRPTTTTIAAQGDGDGSIATSGPRKARSTGTTRPSPGPSTSAAAGTTGGLKSSLLRTMLGGSGAGGGLAGGSVASWFDAPDPLPDGDTSSPAAPPPTGSAPLVTSGTTRPAGTSSTTARPTTTRPPATNSTTTSPPPSSTTTTPPDTTTTTTPPDTTTTTSPPDTTPDTTPTSTATTPDTTPDTAPDTTPASTAEGPLGDVLCDIAGVLLPC